MGQNDVRGGDFKEGVVGGSKCLTFFRGDTGLYCYSTSAVLSMQCMVIKCRDGNIVKNEQLHGNEQ